LKRVKGQGREGPEMVRDGSFFIRSMGVIGANSDSKYFLPTTGHVFERRCGQQLFVLI
jgi:hypothetical protein